MLPQQLVDVIEGMSLSEARRLLSVTYRQGQLPTLTPSGVRRLMFEQVRRVARVDQLRWISSHPSARDPFVKYVFASHDGAVIESVRIPLQKPNRVVVCVSSQTGCAMGCKFCATGRMGAGRNLQPWEMVDQVRQIASRLPLGSRVHGVVFQGMGEPLANVKNVVQAARVMSEPSMLSIDGRGMTVSTAGLIRPLPYLLQQLPRIRLGVSVGHSDPARRAEIMPVERTDPLDKVLEIAANHARSYRIATMLSYTLLAGVNDRECDADGFGDLAKRYADMAQIAPRISLIMYNPIGKNDPFVPSTPEQANKFWLRLTKFAMPVVRRYSGGGDVGAACGQLGAALRGVDALAD